MKRVIYGALIAFVVMTALLLLNTRREINDMKEVASGARLARESVLSAVESAEGRGEKTCSSSTSSTAFGGPPSPSGEGLQEEVRIGTPMTVEVRAYCACTVCTPGHGVTATGTVPVQGRTLAVDPGVIPHGSAVVIGGVEYVAEDTIGGNGYMVEMYFDSHEDARAYGVRREDVIVYE